jgi:hypothetical protein
MTQISTQDQRWPMRWIKMLAVLSLELTCKSADIISGLNYSSLYIIENHINKGILWLLNFHAENSYSYLIEKLKAGDGKKFIKNPAGYNLVVINFSYFKKLFLSNL